MIMRSVASLLTGPGDLGQTIAMTAGEKIDLGQLRRDVASNAAHLVDLTCRRGILVTEDTYWALVGMLSLFQIGAEIVLPQNTTAGALAAIGEQGDLLLSDHVPTDHGPLFKLRRDDGSAWLMREMDPAKCHINLFTSGSAGTPKQVVKSLAVMEREAATIEEIISRDVPAGARVFGTVSHQHLFGLSYKLLWPLCSGRCVDGTVHELWEGLFGQDFRDAVIVTSPAHLTRLGAMDALDEGRRPACVLSAGAFLPLAASMAATSFFGRPICEIYGSTETGTIAWRLRDRVDLAWQPFPGVAVECGADGVLRLRSPFLPDDKVYQGSDLIELDAGGGFRLKGRTDRIAKIDGKRVSLPEIEAQLSALPFVAAVATVVLPGDQPVLGAVIVPSEAGAEALAKIGAFRFGRLLRQALDDRQETAGKPRRWRFVDSLPTNAMGKVVEADLISHFQPPQRPVEPDLRAIRCYGDRIELDLYNRPDLQQLDGHFPGMPIIPGVAQIDWAVKYAARHLHLPIEAAMNFQVKFHRLTLPETLVTLKLEYDAARNRLGFSYHQGDQTLTSGFVRMPQP